MFSDIPTMSYMIFQQSLFNVLIDIYKHKYCAIIQVFIAFNQISLSHLNYKSLKCFLLFQVNITYIIW